MSSQKLGLKYEIVAILFVTVTLIQFYIICSTKQVIVFSAQFVTTWSVYTFYYIFVNCTDKGYAQSFGPF